MTTYIRNKYLTYVDLIVVLLLTSSSIQYVDYEWQ